jgi:hypothetical protein
MSWKQAKRCEQPGCENKAHGRGLCSMHYQRFYEAWKKDCIANGSLTEDSKPIFPEPPAAPKWEYENAAGEAELIAIQERLDAVLGKENSNGE